MTAMRVSDLEQLYDYGSWADARVLQAASSLSAEEFTRPVLGGHSSIRHLLVHAMSATWGWIERAGGPRRGARLREEDYPTPQSVAEARERIERIARGFLGSLRDADLARPMEFSFDDGPKKTLPVGAMLLHAALHGVHHRGQAALLLGLLGHSPGDVDYDVYAAEHPRAGD